MSLFHLVLFVVSVASGAPVELGDEVDCRSLGPDMEIFEDADGTLGIAEVQALRDRFEPVREPHPSLGMTTSAWWVRFDLRGPRGEAPARHWVLDAGWPFADIEFYLPRVSDPQEVSDWEVVKRGLGPESESTAQWRPVVRLPEDISSTRTFYVRAHSDTALCLDLEVLTDKAYLVKTGKKILGMGIFCGVIGGLVVYNLFLFSSLRDRSYLYYSIYMVALGVYVASVHAFVLDFIDMDPGLFRRSFLAFLGLGTLSIGAFTRRFLQTARCSPLIDWAILAWMSAAGITAAGFLIVPIRLQNQIYSLLGLVLPIVCIAAGLKAYLRGYRPARFYLLGWSLHGVGVICYALSFVGVLPLTGPAGWSLQVSSAAEAVLLSLALADRVNVLQEDRRRLEGQAKKLERLALFDHLTGLFCARHFREQLPQQVLIAEEQDRALSLLILDVDDFKQLNDRWGHAEGDEVLAWLGKVVKESVRGADIACRFGGEELAVLLPWTRPREAQAVAERILRRVRKRRFAVPGAVFSVTLSGGVAGHIRGQTPDDLFKRADAALYQAKARGKDCVVVGGDESERAAS